MEELQKAIQEAVRSTINKTNNDIDKPTFEFVATYDAGSLTKYIGN